VFITEGGNDENSMGQRVDPERSVEAAEPAAGRSADDGDPLVDVEGLRKVYGNGEAAVTAVDGVDLQVESGTAVGLLGPNGAGKTTTIECLLGLVVPSGGSVRVADVDVSSQPAQAYHHVGAMLEGARNAYWRLTVRENLSFFAALGGRRPRAVRDRHDELLEQFGLVDRADTAVRELSRGQKQKVSLACTLARDAEVVFLDEPTLGLDVESSLELRRELRRLVEDEEMTVLLSSHDMDVIEAVCDRVVVLSGGAVVADESVENLLDLFDTRAYEVQVADPVDEADRAELRERFDATGFEAVGDGVRFVTQVAEGGFYDVANWLEAGDYDVESFDTVDPDLEGVFLELTDEGGDRA
jgi:ABC-2 type transport system ATP-binding protein